MSSLVSVPVIATKLTRISVLIIFVLAIVMISGRAKAAERDESATLAGQKDSSSTLLGMSAYEPGNCHPGSGWMLTRGLSQPETAAQVRQVLGHMGIDSVVTATGYGEKDSCGDFRMYGIDFNIEVVSLGRAGSPDRQNLVERIHAKLENFVKPNPGNVKITFPDGESIYYQPTRNVYQSQGRASRGLEVSGETTQVDATLPWQDSGIYIESGTVIDLNVISGSWTHYLDGVAYNNGVGSGYICANNIPPEQCAEPMPEAPQGSLIGKIGAHLFAIGSGTRITAQQSGILHLRINDSDDGLFDNDGILTVEEKTHSYQEVVYQPKLYVVIYDPLLSNGQTLSKYMGWADYDQMTEDTIKFFYDASNGRVLYSIVDTTTITDGWPALIDGFRYTEEQFLKVLNGTAEPHQPDNVDYNKIVNDPVLDICDRANRGEIDEVWIFNGPYFGFWESTLVGPGSFWYNSPPVPQPFTCNRIIPIMGPNPERPDMIGHGDGHRMESTMTEIYGGWEENRTNHNWDRFGLVAAQSPDYSYSGCGSIHFPPNGTVDYEYDNKSFTDTNCDDFANYPNLGDPLSTVMPINCLDWGCDHYKYMLYWFGHLPSNPGCGPDGFANDWWPYFLRPELALDPTSICEPPAPVLSINHSTGKPGSYFTVTGVNFPPSKIVSIQINGETITTPVISADSSGNLSFILDTSNAGPGVYLVTVTSKESATTSGQQWGAASNESLTKSFELDPSYPLREKEGNGPVILVPSTVEAIEEQIFNPLVLRD